METIIQFAILFAQFSFTFGIGLCTCNQFQLQFECEDKFLQGACIWEINKCRQKNCQDFSYESDCSYFWSNEFGFSDFSIATTTFQHKIYCYWDGIYCQEFTSCEKISLQLKKNVFFCPFYGCEQGLDEYSCITPTYTLCSQIKEPQICSFPQNNNLDCEWKFNTCANRQQNSCLYLSQHECFQYNQCTLNYGQCTSLGCRDIQESSLCELSMNNCYYKNYQCYPIDRFLSCTDLISETKCEKYRACIWDKNSCRYKYCSDYNCDKQPSGFIGQGIIFCQRNEFNICVPATQCDIFMDNCASTTQFTYSWDQSYCRECNISFEQILSFINVALVAFF